MLMIIISLTGCRNNNKEENKVENTTSNTASNTTSNTTKKKILQSKFQLKK